MDRQGEERLPFDGVMAEVVRDAVAATHDEVRAAVAAAPDAVTLLAGRPAGGVGDDHLWSFEIDRDVEPQPETPGVLVAPGRDPLTVHVIAVGDGTIVISSREDLGAAVAAATLSLTAGFVYERLQERLEHLVLDDRADASLVDALLNPDPQVEPDGLVPYAEGGPDAEQLAAASNAIVDGLRFTWGPPGTGKTRVLALAVSEAASRGDRVLVVAHANAAVDVAMARVAEIIDDEVMEGGHVLRVGTPHLPVVADHPALLPDHHLATHEPELVGRREQLEAERRRYSDRMRSASDAENDRLSNELTDLRDELRQVERQLTDAGRTLVADAQVIGTTLARLVVDTSIWEWEADVVIVDEASMVGLPFALALAARRPRSLSFFGDFRQLPPIAVGQSEQVQRWYGRDVFEAAGVVAANDAGTTDRRVHMLRTQFRMGEQICAVINPFAYDGMLSTHPSARDRAIHLAERWPEAGDEVVIVDTAGLNGECSTDATPDSFSRFGLANAALSVSIAEAIAAEVAVDVGIISPYRAQVALAAASTHDHPRITAATIHRFQGSERDVIVLDLTDGPDQTRSSRLTGGDADLALRLLNVAASRARGKLIVVADLAWIDRHPPLGSTIRNLRDALDDAGASTVDAVQLLAGAPPVPDASPFDPVVSWLPSWDQAIDALSADDHLATCRRLEVHLPSADHADARIFEALARRTADPAATTVLRAPASVARPAEHLDLSVSLLTTGRVPWAIVDDALWFGGRSPDDPACQVTGRRVVTAYGRLAGTT